MHNYIITNKCNVQFILDYRKCPYFDLGKGIEKRNEEEGQYYKR